MPNRLEKWIDSKMLSTRNRKDTTRRVAVFLIGVYLLGAATVLAIAAALALSGMITIAILA